MAKDKDQALNNLFPVKIDTQLASGESSIDKGLNPPTPTQALHEEINELFDTFRGGLEVLASKAEALDYSLGDDSAQRSLLFLLRETLAKAKAAI